MNRLQIENQIRAFIKEGCDHFNEDRFDFLARELFCFQFENNTFYKKFCERVGKKPSSITTWKEIPYLPVNAFKTSYVGSFPKGKAKYVFRTSGTTQPERGELYLDSLTLYELSLLTAFKYFCLPDIQKVKMASLIPSFQRASDSSLSCMISSVVSVYGTFQSSLFFENEKPDYERLVKFLNECCSVTEPVMLFGTSIGFLDFFDYCQARNLRFSLPRRSRLMDTGGSKGKKRKIARADLYKCFEAVLDLDPVYCINEYGMTELGSQFYDSSLRDHLFGETGEIEKLSPPWVAARVVDPLTGNAVKKGHEGVLCYLDLANVGSVLAIETEDLGISMERGFQVLDRIPMSEPRGCSLGAEECLSV